MSGQLRREFQQLVSGELRREFQQLVTGCRTTVTTLNLLNYERLRRNLPPVKCEEEEELRPIAVSPRVWSDRVTARNWKGFIWEARLCAALDDLTLRPKDGTRKVLAEVFRAMPPYEAMREPLSGLAQLVQPAPGWSRWAEALSALFNASDQLLEPCWEVMAVNEKQLGARRTAFGSLHAWMSAL